jgi:hypothetical protein
MNLGAIFREYVWPHVLGAPDLKVVARAEHAAQTRGAASAATARAAMASGGGGGEGSRKQPKKGKGRRRGRSGGRARRVTVNYETKQIEIQNAAHTSHMVRWLARHSVAKVKEPLEVGTTSCASGR